MIVSASYKTDIPAFYGPWFARRLAAGTVRTVNPYGGQVNDLALTREAVDGFVFWTRNPAPFAACLSQVARRWPFVVQFTILGYPRRLDRSVPAPATAVATFRALAATYGATRLVWRYDPILFTSLTTPAWHAENFAQMARALAGACDEVVVSFTHIYAKTGRNLARAGEAAGFTWFDPPMAEKQAFLASLAPVAQAAGMRLTLCAQPDLSIDGVAAAACIDPTRLFGPNHGRRTAMSRNRPGCRCAAARDIGHYETCPHGCVYCYAVADMDRAKTNHAAHDPSARLLVERRDTAAP